MNLLIYPGHKSAHVTTAGLLWHVEMCGLIWELFIEFITCIFIRFDWWAHGLLVKDVPEYNAITPTQMVR